MKHYPHVVKAITNSLIQIFSEKKYADKVIEKYIKGNRRWGSHDRRFFAENVYDGVRWWRRNWYLMGQEPELTAEAMTRFWAVGLILRGVELPDWPEVEDIYQKTNQIKQRAKDLPLAIQESIPDWINEWGEKEK
jgi:16S rRNA (cytosine967-C5)-methyltransferase